MNFITSSGNGSPTRFLVSAGKPFLKLEYLTYKLPLPGGPVPTISWGLLSKRDPVQPSGLIDSFSFLELCLLLMTQESICSPIFLITHASTFSFLSSGTLKLTFPSQSVHSFFTHQSLISDKITELCRWKWRLRGLVLFLLHETF